MNYYYLLATEKIKIPENYSSCRDGAGRENPQKREMIFSCALLPCLLSHKSV